MKNFAELFNQLDQTNKTNEKVSLLKQYFLSNADKDRIWALALFCHRRPKRTVNTRLLREWTAEAAGIPTWLFEESYQVVGDLAETMAKILPKANSREEHSLSYWIEYLLALKDQEEKQKKKAILKAWTQLDTQQRFVFTKLLTGGFRVGVSQNLITRALSEAFAIEKSQIAHRLMGNWDPLTTNFNQLILAAEEEVNHSRPYPFYLAHPLASAPEELGPIDDWQAEWKWDGIRGQLIKRSNEVFLWSRGEELITDRFPEIRSLNDQIPNGTVIDGEILGFKDQCVLNFGALQSRIGRKSVPKKLLEEVPVVLRAYDLLEWEGKDFRDKPLAKRTAILADWIQVLQQTNLHYSQPLKFDSWQALGALQKQARDHQAEGLMLKRLDSTYGVGRKRGDWWKWKVDPLHIDGVMIYAQRGHGRRANLYSDFTFGVWDGESLVPFTKAYSGLNDQEMAEVDRFVKRNTLERFGPVRTVTPELVFELAFEGIRKSKRHKSGVALRFPRISRWRKDKKASDANHLQDLHQLLENYG